MENLTGGTPPVRYLLCVVPCKLYFASVKTTGGKERQKGDTEEQQTVSFTVRFCKKLSELSAADYRIVFRGKTYNILQVDFADYDGKTVKIKAESEENYGSISTGNDE
mgnify:FL=1